jgi:hypothetical protein
MKEPGLSRVLSFGRGKESRRYSFFSMKSAFHGRVELVALKAKSLVGKARTGIAFEDFQRQFAAVSFPCDMFSMGQ